MKNNKLTAGVVIILLFAIVVISSYSVYPKNIISLKSYDDFNNKISDVNNSVKEAVFDDYYKQADEVDIAVTKYLTQEKGYTAVSTSYKTPSEYWGSSIEAENQVK